MRPVYFPRINGRMEWTAPDGVEYEATFDDRLARDLASQRLRTALAVEGEWMPAVLAQAHAQLMHLRARDPHAAGLVITMDQEHAKAIAGVLEARLGVTPTVATSDDPAASDKISRFADGIAPWIVAVRMVSEGVDIPRLRVGVYATNTVTELFFRQAVGRLVRWNARLGRQAAYMFIPDDVRLRKFGGAIAEQRRHCLRKESRDDDDGAQREEGPSRRRKRPRPSATSRSSSRCSRPSRRRRSTSTAGPLNDGPRVYDAAAPTTTRTARSPTSPRRRAGSPTARAFRWTPRRWPGGPAAGRRRGARRRAEERHAGAAAAAARTERRRGHRPRPPDRPHPRRHQRRAQSQGRHQAHQHRDAAPARTTARAGARDAEGPLAVMFQDVVPIEQPDSLEGGWIFE